MYIFLVLLCSFLCWKLLYFSKNMILINYNKYTLFWWIVEVHHWSLEFFSQALNQGLLLSILKTVIECYRIPIFSQNFLPYMKGTFIPNIACQLNHEQYLQMQNYFSKSVKSFLIHESPQKKQINQITLTKNCMEKHFRNQMQKPCTFFLPSQKLF